MAEIAVHCKAGVSFDGLMASVCPPRFDFWYIFFFVFFSVSVEAEMSDILRLYPRLEFLSICDSMLKIC